MTAIMTKRLTSPANLRKVAAATRKRNRSKKFKAERSLQMREFNLKQWKIPSYRTKMARMQRKTMNRQMRDPKFRKSLRASPSRSQLCLFYRLRCRIQGLRLEYLVGKYLVDIAHLPTKTAIESDGIYWHGTPEAKKRDRARDRFLEGQGWKVIRLPIRRISEAKSLDLDPILERMVA